MRDTLFPRWQGAFLAVFLLADGLYLETSPKDIFSFLISTIIFALITFIYLKLLAYFNIRDFEALCLKVPSFIGKPLLFIVGLTAVFVLILSGIRLSKFWQITAFPAIPQYLSMLVLFFVAWRAGRRGRTAVEMWAYPTAYLCIFIIVISLFITISDSTPEYAMNLPKYFNFGISTRFLYLIPALLLCTQTENLSTTKHCTTGVIIGGLGLTLIALRAYLVLGLACSKLPYPCFSAAGVFSVGDFLQRGEVIFACSIVLCEAVRSSLMLTLAITCFRSAIPALRKFKR